MNTEKTRVKYKGHKASIKRVHWRKKRKRRKKAENLNGNASTDPGPSSTEQANVDLVNNPTASSSSVITIPVEFGSSDEDVKKITIQIEPLPIDSENTDRNSIFEQNTEKTEEIPVVEEKKKEPEEVKIKENNKQAVKRKNTDRPKKKGYVGPKQRRIQEITREIRSNMKIKYICRTTNKIYADAAVQTTFQCFCKPLEKKPRPKKKSQKNKDVIPSTNAVILSTNENYEMDMDDDKDPLADTGSCSEHVCHRSPPRPPPNPEEELQNAIMSISDGTSVAPPIVPLPNLSANQVILQQVSNVPRIHITDETEELIIKEEPDDDTAFVVYENKINYDQF